MSIKTGLIANHVHAGFYNPVDFRVAIIRCGFQRQHRASLRLQDGSMRRGLISSSCPFHQEPNCIARNTVAKKESTLLHIGFDFINIFLRMASK